VLNPEWILNLQRHVGNTIVTTLIELASASARGSGATVQRAPLPAADDPHGYTQPQGVQNVAKTGLTRLEVHGLKYGVSGGFQKEYGRRTSAEKRMTDESPDHMAVVIMPDKLDPDRPVQVALHFHGWGFRQEKGVKDPYAGYLVASGRTASKKGDVRDVDLEHWEQQMSAVVAARSAKQPQIVAILVQGRGKSEFGNVPTYGYVQEVFGKVSALSGIKSTRSSSPPTVVVVKRSSRPWSAPARPSPPTPRRSRRTLLGRCRGAQPTSSCCSMPRGSKPRWTGQRSKSQLSGRR